MSLQYLQDNLKMLIVDADVCISNEYSYEQVLTDIYNDLIKEDEITIFTPQSYIDDMHLIKDLYNKLNK